MPVSQVPDSQLMLLADGELDPAEASAVERDAGAPGASKVAGIREVGVLVRGQLELATDDAEPRLSRLWDQVERRLDLDSLPAPAPTRRSSEGLWGRLMGWVGEHRGHFVTGAVSALAVT